MKKKFKGKVSNLVNWSIIIILVLIIITTAFFPLILALLTGNLLWLLGFLGNWSLVIFEVYLAGVFISCLDL